MEHSTSQSRTCRSQKRCQKPWKVDYGQRNLWWFVLGSWFTLFYEISWSKNVDLGQSYAKSIKVSFLFPPTAHLHPLDCYHGIDVGQMSLNTFFNTFYSSRWPYHSPSHSLQPLLHRSTTAIGLKHLKHSPVKTKHSYSLASPLLQIPFPILSPKVFSFPMTQCRLYFLQEAFCCHAH